jgi:hypothetical protein
MQRTGRTLGMNIEPPLAAQTLRFPARDTSELQLFFTSMKDKRVDLIVVVIPDERYSYGKRSVVLIKYSSTIV